MRKKPSQLIDISLPLGPELPAWPGSSGFHLERTGCLEAGDPANVSRLECEVHFGTHIDAPRHFFHEGAAVDQLALEIMIGPAYLAHLPDCRTVAKESLQELALPPGTERLLLRTANSQLWAAGAKSFRTDYVALSEEAAHWIVARGIRLLGIDYLSVQRFGDGPEVHRILLAAGVVLLEGLNLAAVAPGAYELICLPLKLVGADGSPARAVLRVISQTNAEVAKP